MSGRPEPHLLDAGSADLRGDGPAVVQDHAMDLRDRGRGHRRRSSIEAKIVVSGRSYSSIRIASASSNGNGQDVVAKRADLGRISLGQEVGASTEHLTELDERRAKIFADHLQAARRSCGGTSSPSATRSDGLTKALQMKGRDHILISVLHQGRQGSGGTGNEDLRDG